MQFDVVIVVKGDSEQQTEKRSTLADFENATLGIVTGTSWDIVAQKKFPNIERKYFTTSADVLLALEQGKVDVFFVDKTVYAGIRWENSSIAYIDEPIEQVSNALIFAKQDYDENLLNQVNEFIAKSKENGTLDRLSTKWFADSEPEEHPDYTKLTGENGTLRIAVCDSHRPVSYQRGTMYTGYEMDFLTLFAEEYGYRLDPHGMAFDALIPSVSSGKCDIGACGLTITPERSESVTFSDPHIETYGVAIIRAENNQQKNTVQNPQTLKELENGQFAILTGSVWGGVLQEMLPNAEAVYFSNMTDMTLSLDQRKVDAILGDETFYLNARWDNVPVALLDERIGAISCSMILSKDAYDPVLLEQLNTFIAQSKADGTIDALRKKWLTESEPAEHPDYTTLTGENGTLKIAVENAARPMTYQKNVGFTGFDVELLTMFAKEYGYRLEFTGMSFDALIPTISSSKCDIGVCGIAITEERAQSVTYTDSYTEIYGVVIVNENVAVAGEESFIDEISESFEKTFIREDRWKLIVKGIGVTMLISICSAVTGTLLGFGLYMLSRSDKKLLQMAAKGVAKVYSRIIAGTPVVVILMILFYVIFGKVRDMSGILVAIIGFTLTFGAFVYDHMTVSVGSVDRGQTEAAYALGYTKNKTFFRIIFPQAMTIFLPSYCGQAVELIKATAVVGYVAVNDLTKMGDIIRSNTYEAFFPLIATAVIYFLLTWILASLLKLLKLCFEPKRRSKETILKGVKTR
jgi:polar amino acid transport system substrate-binding protein